MSHDYRVVYSDSVSCRYATKIVRGAANIKVLSNGLTAFTDKGDGEQHCIFALPSDRICTITRINRKKEKQQ